MSAETALYSVLTAAPAVTAIVGTDIYPDAVPQEVGLPSVAILRTGTEFVMTVHGGLAATRATMEVWCMAGTRAAAEALADAVQQAIIAANFMPSDRRPDYSSEEGIFATVLLIDYWN